MFISKIITLKYSYWSYIILVFYEGLCLEGIRRNQIVKNGINEM
jgi:hypothetical protein